MDFKCDDCEEYFPEVDCMELGDKKLCINCYGQYKIIVKKKDD